MLGLLLGLFINGKLEFTTGVPSENRAIVSTCQTINEAYAEGYDYIAYGEEYQDRELVITFYVNNDEFEPIYRKDF